jgi:hypothetical protein
VAGVERQEAKEWELGQFGLGFSFGRNQKISPRHSKARSPPMNKWEATKDVMNISAHNHGNKYARHYR